MLFARLTNYPKYRIYINGDIYSENGNRSKYLKHRINTKHKYKYVSFWNENGEKIFKIHRLMGILFLPCNKSFDESSIDHINRDKHDNSLKNLRWCDKSTQRINQTYVPTKSGFPFIAVHNNNKGTTILYCAQILRNGILFRKRRVKLEDAVNIMREFIIKNYDLVMNGLPDETKINIIDAYNLSPL